MTGISPSRIDRLALHRTAPTQSPVALLPYGRSVRAYPPTIRVHHPCAFRPIWTLIVQFAPSIVTPHINTIAQIAIARRLC